VQGLPFFGETWSYLGAFLELTGDLATLRALTERARQHLKEYAFDGQALWLECLERNDVTPLIAALEHTVQEGMALGWPVGYPAICLAVLQSQRTDDPQEAEHILDAVTLSDEDPPLLDDIRLLARCAVAHRAGNDEREALLIRQFLERQPMLLEPSRAFDVRLLWRKLCWSWQKIVVPPFIGVNVDATSDLGVLWDNMNIYVACNYIRINFYTEKFWTKTLVD